MSLGLPVAATVKGIGWKIERYQGKIEPFACVGEDNAGVNVNPKGEMKGSAITGPIGKECADLWPRSIHKDFWFCCLMLYLGFALG
ncbi:60S ribosomal protein L23 [Trifolium repens]|nr:60S ribosomal protein L23 [Trifolium repens]